MIERDEFLKLADHLFRAADVLSGWEFVSGEKMSGVVKIEIRETAAQLKDLMRQEKDAVRQEKLQVLYWLKTQMVDSVLYATVRLGNPQRFNPSTSQRDAIWLSRSPRI